MNKNTPRGANLESCNPKAAIFGVQSTQLTQAEKIFFRETNPLGFILFSRNCISPKQVKSLVTELRQGVAPRFDRMGRPMSPPILIDQEGGRVNRLLPPLWNLAPPARYFGQIAEQDLEKALQEIQNSVGLVADQLTALGINVNCAPVVDLFHEESSDIIGDRALSAHPEIVVPLAVGWAKRLQQKGIVPVIKHFPGHGRALVDSHKELPVLATPFSELLSHDFYAFQQVCELMKGPLLPWGMTAHILYKSVDPHHPVTFSSKIISEIIRGQIGFQGFLISDCLTMEALSGSYFDRACQAIKAGCDAVLHCNGNLEEMIEVAAATPSLSPDSLARLGRSL